MIMVKNLSDFTKKPEEKPKKKFENGVWVESAETIKIWESI